MVPTYLPTSARHLDFNNLVGSYDGGPAGYPELRGWGELGHPSGPVASVPSGSWAAPTSPPSQPHNAEEADRPHEDSVNILQLVNFHFCQMLIVSHLHLHDNTYIMISLNI